MSTKFEGNHAVITSSGDILAAFPSPIHASQKGLPEKNIFLEGNLTDIQRAALKALLSGKYTSFYQIQSVSKIDNTSLLALYSKYQDVLHLPKKDNYGANAKLALRVLKEHHQETARTEQALLIGSQDVIRSYIYKLSNEGISSSTILHLLWTGEDETVFNTIEARRKQERQPRTREYIRDHILFPALDANQQEVNAILAEDPIMQAAIRKLVHNLNEDIAIFSSVGARVDKGAMHQIWDFIEESQMGSETFDQFLLILGHHMQRPIFVVKPINTDEHAEDTSPKNFLVVKNLTQFLEHLKNPNSLTNEERNFIYAVAQFIRNEYHQAERPLPLSEQYLLPYAIQYLSQNYLSRTKSQQRKEA